MPTVTPLNVWNVGRYAPMVASTVRHWLDRLGPDGPVFAFGCAEGDAAAGVALIVEAAGAVEIAWIYVVPSLRRHGAASALLDAVECHARARARRRLRITHPSAPPESLPITAALTRHGFRADEPRFTVCMLDVASIARTRWFERWTRSPATGLFAWSDLTNEERAALALRYPEDPLAMDGLSPLRQELGFDPRTSIGMRRDDEVVGWFLCRPAGKGLQQYSLFGVREHLWGTGSSFAMVVESMRRHLAIDGEDARGILTTANDNVPMTKLLTGRGTLAPHVMWTRDVCSSSKRID